VSTDPKIWTAAILTIIVYSYLFKENEFYKAVEHLYVGVAAGYTMVMGYTNLTSKVWTPLTQKGSWWVLIPTIIGVMLFAPYLGKNYAWLRRIPVAVIAGIGAALGARSAVLAQFITQLKASMIPLTSVNNVIIALGTITTLAYFLFAIKPNPVLKAGVGAGKWVIMVTLGAAFGAGIMGRISLLIGRLFLVFHDWIPLIK